MIVIGSFSRGNPSSSLSKVLAVFSDVAEKFVVILVGHFKRDWI